MSRFAIFVMFFVISSHSPAWSEASDEALITLFGPSESLRFHVKDFRSLSRKPRDAVQETVIVDVTPDMAERIHAFTTPRVNRQVVTLILGVIENPGIFIREPVRGSPIHWTFHRGSKLASQWIKAFETKRNNPAAAGDVLMTMFELTDEIRLPPDQIARIDVSGPSAEIRLKTPVADFGPALAPAHPDDWRLAVGQHMIARWHYALKDGDGVLTLSELQPAVIVALEKAAQASPKSQR